MLTHDRQINREGLELIKKFEGCKLTSYKCPAGIWTIGYGHTGISVHANMTITQEEADALLLVDLHRFCDGVDKLVITPLSDNEFSALVSFTYNVGLEAFRKSTMLKKLIAVDFPGAANEFPKWNKVNGAPLAGLIKRRAAEKALFES